MLMFVDMGERGVDEKITDYVDVGGIQKFDLFCVKSEICFSFQTKILYF